MTKRHFKGEIKHDQDTLRRLFKTVLDVYHLRYLVFRTLSGFILVISALLLNTSLAVQGIMMMFGCWLIVSQDFPARCRADRTIGVRGKNNLPVVVTDFYEDYLVIDNKSDKSISYESFSVLRKDDESYYMFIDEQSACMLSKASLTPQEPEEFEKFVSEKTGLEWKDNLNWFNMNLKELLQILSNK